LKTRIGVARNSAGDADFLVPGWRSRQTGEMGEAALALFSAPIVAN
jgi:hypothetical protein